MKTLNEQELRTAEESLRRFLPKSQEVYGCVFMMNRVQADPADVLVDQWPDFNVLIIKPKQQEEGDLFKDISIFTTDETILKRILVGTDIFDWKRYLCININLCHKEMLQSVAKSKGMSENLLAVCHLLTLQDPSHLTFDRQLEVSSLNESHVALINSTWKFGEKDFSKRMIENMIKNFPSCCVLDSVGQPMAWILTYPSCAMGMLYTLPEHRRKGYAKALITTLAKKLHSDGYPLFSCIEEENHASYKLFTSLGFTEDATYRIAWYSFH